MDKPIIKVGDIELHHYRGRHVFPLFENMSKENIREFAVVYKMNILEALISALDDDLCHVVEVKGTPVAICGVREGVLWTMFSKDIRKHWRSFVKASPRLVKFYHSFYDKLYCNVWEENVFILNWLVHLGFEPYSIEEREHPIVNFVRCNRIEYGVGSKESRPVMH